jgi:N6-adenosine-specific RNA methylase IME4
VAEVLDEVRGAALVHADPPWSYDNASCQGTATDSYDTISMGEIAGHVGAAHEAANDNAYMLLWCTFPKLAEWMGAACESPWAYKSGGAWAKADGFGVGYHWRGDSEPALLYTKGNPRPVTKNASNLCIHPRTRHSEKPETWLCDLLEAWTNPGDLVLDLYAGLAPMARACKATGRDYIGAEIDEERHRHAMAKLDGTPYHKDVRQMPLGMFA